MQFDCRHFGIIIYLTMGLMFGSTHAFAISIGCKDDSDCGNGESCEHAREKSVLRDEYFTVGSCTLRGPSGVIAKDCFAKRTDGTKAYCLIEVSKRIAPAGVSFIEKVFKSSNPVLQISLDSNGGDIRSAMRLGRIIRRIGGSVYVDKSSTCASACIFVLAAGVSKQVADGAIIAVHRPYGAEARSKNYQQANDEWRLLQKDLKAYLDEMNVPTTLLDKMNRYPSNEAYVLSVDEIRDYGLSGYDPAYEEQMDSNEAAKRNISRAELLRRKSAFDKCAAAFNTAITPTQFVDCGRTTGYLIQ